MKIKKRVYDDIDEYVGVELYFTAEEIYTLFHSMKFVDSSKEESVLRSSLGEVMDDLGF